MKTILLIFAIGVVSVAMGQTRWVTRPNLNVISIDSLVMRKAPTPDTVYRIVKYFDVKDDTIGTFQDSALVIRIEKSAHAYCGNLVHRYSIWIPSRVILLSGRELNISQVIWKEEYYWDSE